MSHSVKRVVFAAHIVVVLAMVLGLAACSRSSHVTDSLAGPGHVAGQYKNGVNPPPPPPPPPGAVVVRSVTLTPTSVSGGTSSAGSVRLDQNAPTGGAVVNLSSSDVTVAKVPASITVAAGQSNGSFTVTTVAVTATHTVTITANNVSATLSVTAPAVAPPPAVATLSSVTLAPASVGGGAASQGTVLLTLAAPAGGAIVTLTSDNVAATVPASVTIPAGATSATFALATTPVVATSSAIVTATYNGLARTATLTVLAASLSSVTLAPAAITAGNPSTGTVTLTSAAAAAGALVTLASSLPAAAGVPASVTVAAGATSATFAVTTPPAILASAPVITATFNGLARTATLAIAASDPCKSVTSLGGAVVIATNAVKQFRTGRLRVDLTGDVPLGWIAAMGGCAVAAVPAVSVISGTADVLLAGSATSVIPAGALTFGPLAVPVPVEAGTVLATDAAGNVLQIVWPALAGLPVGPPVLRVNLVAWSPAVATGVLLDANLSYTVRGPDGSIAVFTAHGANMPVPTFIP